jgi:hypothetical protein
MGCHRACGYLVSDRGLVVLACSTSLPLAHHRVVVVDVVGMLLQGLR